MNSVADMRGLYVVFWIFWMLLVPKHAKRCEERPLNIVIDSTNRTSRRNFNVQLAIVNNVTSRLRRGAGDVRVLANIFQYNRNDMCRHPRASTCVKHSPDVEEPKKLSEKRVIAAAGLVEYNSSRTFEQFSNQPFCLACAEYNRVRLTHQYGGNGLGLILTTYPSMKKYIHSGHHVRYRRGGEYYMALLYKTPSPNSRKMYARRSSNVSQLVEIILRTVCPDRFSPRVRAKELPPDKPTVAPTGIHVKRLSVNVTTTAKSSVFVESLKATGSGKSIMTNMSSGSGWKVETDSPIGRVKTDNNKSSPISVPASIQDESISPHPIPSKTNDPRIAGEMPSSRTLPTIVAPDRTGMPGSVQTPSEPIPVVGMLSRIVPSVHLVTQLQPSSIAWSVMGISSFPLLIVSRGETTMSTLGAKSDLQSVVSNLTWERINVSHGHRSTDVDYVRHLTTADATERSFELKTKVNFLMTGNISLRSDESVTPCTRIPGNATHGPQLFPIPVTTPSKVYVSHNSTVLENEKVGAVLTKTIYPSESSVKIVNSTKLVPISSVVNFTKLVPMKSVEQPLNHSIFSLTWKRETTHTTFVGEQQAIYSTKTFSTTNNSAIVLAASVQTSFTERSYPSIIIPSLNTSSEPTSPLPPPSSVLQVNAHPTSIFVTHATEGSISPVPTLNPTGVDLTGIVFTSPLSSPATHLWRNSSRGVFLSQGLDPSSNTTMVSSTTMFAHSSVSGSDGANTSLATPSSVLRQSRNQELHPGLTIALSSAASSRALSSAASAIALSSAVSSRALPSSSSSRALSSTSSPFNSTFVVQKSQDDVRFQTQSEPRDTQSSLAVNNATSVVHSTRNSSALIQKMTMSPYVASDAVNSGNLNQSTLSTTVTASTFKIDETSPTSRRSTIPTITTEHGGAASVSIRMSESAPTYFNHSVHEQRNRSLSELSISASSFRFFETSHLLTTSHIRLRPSASRSLTSSVLTPVEYVPAVVRSMQFMMKQKKFENSTSFHALHLTSWLTGFITNTSAILNRIEEEQEEGRQTSIVQSRLVREKSLDFVEFVGNTTLTIGQKLSVGEKVNVTVDDLLVEIHAVNPLNFNGYTFNPCVAPKQQEKLPQQQQQRQQQQTVRLSPQLFKNSTIKRKVAIASIFMDTIPAMREFKGNFRDIGKVLTISLDVQLNYPLPQTLTYTLHAPRNNFTNYKCVFWNQSHAWDTRGCHVTSVNGTLVTCECNHLTSFSILMQVSEFETHTTHAYVLSVISYIGCAISITGCILLMLTFTMCGRLLKVSRNVIHMNLALAMTISNGLFITADSVHMYRGLCLSVSIVMLYSYLASFFWMLVEGLHVYLMIVKVFKSPSMMKVYLVIGWLLPAVIVTVAGMKFHVNFTRDDFCWISTEGNVIWVFVGPVLLVIGINIAILIKALSTSYKMAVAETAFLKLQETARLTMLLMPIFGLTWIFGLLAINKQMIVFQYLFTISNSLQGLYIFVCYCLMNNEVRTEFQRIRQKYSYGSAHSTSTESNSAYNPLFTKRAKAKSVVSMDNSNNVKLTRYDSVKTEMTSASSRASSMHYDSLAKRTTKGIELMKLNESFNESKDVDQPNDTFVNDTLSMSSSLCPEEHDYGVRLKYDNVPLTNGFHRGTDVYSRGTDVYTGLEVYQGDDIYSGSVDNCRSISELSNGTCTYDTFRRRNENGAT